MVGFAIGNPWACGVVVVLLGRRWNRGRRSKLRKVGENQPIMLVSKRATVAGSESSFVTSSLCGRVSQALREAEE
jgi:hypothetical protein